MGTTCVMHHKFRAAVVLALLCSSTKATGIHKVCYMQRNNFHVHTHVSCLLNYVYAPTTLLQHAALGTMSAPSVEFRPLGSACTAVGNRAVCYWCASDTKYGWR